MARRDLTLQEAADRLGVHYMTAYRYVRLGLLPARKEGPEWRVGAADLEAFRASERPAGRSRRAPWATRLENRLVAGDAAAAWSVVEGALAAGSDLGDVYLDVIAPAMTAVGERWASGAIDVAVEHQASVITTGILARLGARFTRRGRTKGTVVVGAVAGERHALPVTMVADLVRWAGFAVVNLGADVPPGSFAVAAAGVDRLVAVGVSVTTAGRDDVVAATVDTVRSAVDAPVLVGGRAVADGDEARRLGADGWAPNGRLAATLLDRLVGAGDGQRAGVLDGDGDGSGRPGGRAADDGRPAARGGGADADAGAGAGAGAGVSGG